MPRRSGRRSRLARHPAWVPRPAAAAQPAATAVPAQRPPDPWARAALLPLRLFLGATFAYAALQKLTDSSFLHAGGTTYIGRQLGGFATTSPLHGLLRWLGDNLAVEVGIAVIVVELAVGVAVLLGWHTRAAALAGAAVSFVFFLSTSWDVQPYFLGSDSIYTVAWLSLALVGDQGLLVVQGLERRQLVLPRPFDPGRRAMLVQLGGAAVALVWVLGLLPRSRAAAGAPTAEPSLPAEASAAPSSPPSAAPATASPSPPPSSAPLGTAIGSLDQLRSQGSIAYQDPHSGDPAVAVDLGNNNVVAFDAVCTHAGCTVQYDPSQKLLYCPCHGAVFDPAHQAQVLQGPAPTPLSPLPVTVASDGTIHAAG
jgi:thiosulfate dehydrogenase [quinone] large subunit